MPTQAEIDYVEKVGLAFEQLTLPRMAGRIFGWLLIAETPIVGLGDLVERLKASKSAVSTTTRLLVQIELIELVSLPGDRRDYFRIRSDAWANTLRARIKQAGEFRRLAESGLALLAQADTARRRRLEQMHSLYALLESDLPLLLEKWENQGFDPA
jgi:DNA-binding transcriptional regulator GbsR (MarR family)